MMQEIIEERPMALHEVREQLAKIKKRDGELNFRANKTQEYLESVMAISQKAAKELYDKLIDMKIPRLKEIHIAKIVDVLPKEIGDLKAIMQGYAITINNDNAKKIIAAIQEVL